MRSMFATLLCIAMSVTAVPATLTDGLEIAPDVYAFEHSDGIGWTYVYWWLQAAIEGEDPEIPTGPVLFNECDSITQVCTYLPGEPDMCQVTSNCFIAGDGFHRYVLTNEETPCDNHPACSDPITLDSMNVTPGWLWERTWDWLVDTVEGDDPVYPEPFDCTGEDVWLFQDCHPIEPGSDICEVDIFCLPEQEPGETGQGTLITSYTVECANDPLCELYW